MIQHVREKKHNLTKGSELCDPIMIGAQYLNL